MVGILRELSKGKQFHQNKSKKGKRISSSMVWWQMPSRWYRRPPASASVSAEEVRRVPRKRGPGQPRRPTHPRGRRERGRERKTFEPRALGSRRVPGDSRVGAGPSPRPSGSTHSASGQQESHSPKPPPSAPPGEGAEGCFEHPLVSPQADPGLSGSRSGQVQPVLRDSPSTLPLPRPRPRPGLGAAPIG